MMESVDEPNSHNYYTIYRDSWGIVPYHLLGSFSGTTKRAWELADRPGLEAPATA